MVTGGLGAIAGRPPEDITIEGYPYSEMRPGCYDPVARLEGHGRGRHPGVAELPVVPALLRPAVLRGQGQGPRPAVRQGLQRLDDRRVVRRRAGPLHPADDHPAVGPAARRSRRSSACAAKGVERRLLLREPRAARPADHPRPERLLGPRAARRPRRPADGRCAMHIGSSSTMHKMSSTSPFMANMSLGAIRPAGAMLSWIFSGAVPAVPEHQDRPVRGLDRVDPVLPRAGRARSYDTQRHWVAKGLQYQRQRRRGRPRTRHAHRRRRVRHRRVRATTASTSTAASSTTRPGSACSTWSARTT